MRGVALCSVLLSGCILYSEGGDDVPWPDDAADAPEIDAPLIDAPSDTLPDCLCQDPPIPQVSGRILLYEVDQLDPESDGSLGQGLLAEINFQRQGDLPSPIVDTQPGTVFGCKAWVFNRPQAIAAAVGLGEGTVQLGLPGLEPPPVGACTFTSGTGYQCPGATAITPGLADPGTLPDLQGIDVQLTSGGEGHVASFSGSGPDVGDDFTLTPESLALLESIPRDGTAFTIGCDSAMCNSGAIATELQIVTTDAPITGLPSTAMPLPISRRVVIRCAAVATPTLTVPAVVSQILSNAMATRVQTTYRRARFANTSSTTLCMAGHAISGISD